MKILGIETSCDDTGIAIYDQKSGLLAYQTHNQKKHAQYGGIVPELASRYHSSMIIPLIRSTLKQAKTRIEEIQGISYTAGPGMIGSLTVGATVACSIAYSQNKLLVPVNHMEGHLLSPMLKTSRPHFPFIALLISGGHTQLISADKIGKYKVLGQSLDDSIGETFDKIAKLLDLSYPWGPNLEKIAREGTKGKFFFPIPMIKKSNLSFSFSGLKTAVSSAILNNDQNFQTKADIARAFERSVIKMLKNKCRMALSLTGFNQLVLAGGVSANKKIREKLGNMMKETGGKLFYPKNEFCTDNGAMIAYVGFLRMKNAQENDLKILVNPNWSIENISPIRIE